MSGKKFCVYIHENKENGKVYVGITSQKPQNRFRDNGKGYFLGYKNKTAFQYAIEKYGWDGFNHIIVIDGIPEERAKQIEKSLISLFSSNDHVHGYNLTEGGDGVTGIEVPEAVRKARSERMKGIQFSEETRKKMSEAKIGFEPWNKGKHPGATENQIQARRARARKVQTVDGIFDTVKDCAEFYGVERKTMQNWLSGKRKPSRRYAHICATYIEESNKN